MKTSVAFLLVIAGGLLVAAPVLSSQWQLRQIAKFYEERGEGSTLPQELRARPFARLEWACFATGAVMILGGAWAGRQRHVVQAVSPHP